MSRGSDTIETVWPTGSSEATIIVSVSDALRSGSLSTPTSRTLIRSPSLGTGPSAATRPSVARRRLEDAGERVAHERAVAPDGDVREHDEQRDDHDADDPEAPGRPRPAGVEERLPDGQQPPGQDQPVEDQQRAQDLRRDDPRRQPRRRLGLDEHDRERDDDERGDQEEGRQAGPPVEQLAEPRDQRRQAGRGEAATVRGPRVGPDPGCLSAGLQDVTPRSCTVAADVRAESTRA